MFVDFLGRTSSNLQELLPLLPLRATVRFPNVGADRLARPSELNLVQVMPRTLIENAMRFVCNQARGVYQAWGRSHDTSW